MTGLGDGPAGRTATPVRAVGRRPPNLAALAPGLGLALASNAPILLSEIPQRPRGNQAVLHLCTGPLQTPHFHRNPPWLSGALSGGWAGVSGGGLLPGSAEAAVLAALDDASLLRRAAAGAAAMVRHRVGGAAWADPPAAALARPGIGLVAVQCSGDAGRDRSMLQAVLARHDAARVVVADALPPLAATAAAAGCRVLPPGAFDPWPLIELANEVHVADGGTLGLLALLAGRTVHAHAPAWFAGWGITEDGPDVPPRAAARSPAQVAVAGLLGGASYADPFTGQPTTFEAALDIAVEWRRITDANRGIAGCVGMQFWKRQRIGAFLHTGTQAPPHGAAALAAARRTGGAVAAWASRMPDGLTEVSIPVLRVEDGFLRSVGLGSDFLPPCSIVLDGTGIYYDPSRPSDLEAILAGAEFDPAMLERAGRLIERLVRGAVTKYNVGSAPLPDLPAGARVVLVPGQVADDLSVRLGGGAVQSNLALLQAVRAANPGAHILYKPHPDVDAGHRPGAILDAQALGIADQLVRGVPMAPLIEAVHEVHTLTSLAGFEALLRRRAVTCWGQPFYSGWGLTRDMAPMPRRTRMLSLRELAAGVLLLYPRYLDPATGLPCPAEVLLDRLADPLLWRAGPLVRLRRMQGAAAGWMSRVAARSARRSPDAGRNKA